VTGVAAGTATISYTIAPATVFTAVVTVNAVSLSSIGFSTGPGYLCTGGSPVTCTVSPMSGNAWSSSNTAVATVNSGGLVVPTSTAGTSIITYHHGAGNCNVTEVVSVYPTPTVSLSSPMCNAASQTATATPGGGTWASSNTSVATINSSTGDMTGHAGGSTNINYVSTNGCRKLTLLSVANLPGTISGTLTTCMGSTTTLSSTTSGGIWSTGTPSVATIGAGTGIVTPVSAGTADITYTAGTGCVRTAIVTINAALTSNTGNALVCVGQSTSLSNPTSGGTWSSSATSKATVGYYSGNVNAISAGTANITYSIAGGCRAITEVTVNGTMAAISGTTSVCVGETTTLNHAISGGTWSSSNTTSATIDMTSGLVSGVAPGYSIITYTVSSGCYKTTVVYVRHHTYRWHYRRHLEQQQHSNSHYRRNQRITDRRSCRYNYHLLPYKQYGMLYYHNCHCGHRYGCGYRYRGFFRSRWRYHYFVQCCKRRHMVLFQYRHRCHRHSRNCNRCGSRHSHYYLQRQQ
jgi:trimeric autotransporter adhesin